tara:strand:+ start:199 stop:1926 length:1728 start_codon:yes stop_codon:yes gene_type:complete
MKDSLNILGINYGGHDTSACLIINEKLIAACEEERYSKIKHTREFPINAINDCLKIGNISIDELDEIALSIDPVYLIRENYLKSALEDEERIEFLINDIERIKQSYNIKEIIREKTKFKGTIRYHLHHHCHLASSYYVSGFDEALLVSHDGIGEIESSHFGVGKNGEISTIHKGTRYPNSLGLIYSAITHYLGWKHHSDEGIIMGLAPYGDDTKIIPDYGKTYRNVFKEIILEDGDFDFIIEPSWISYYHVRDKWISEKFIDVFGPIRKPETDVTEHHKNIAAALQNRIEEIILKQLKIAKERFQLKKLCFAGGVALNCVLNGKITENNLFDEIFVQPASGDNGAALGACLLSHKILKGNLSSKKIHDFYLGSKFTNDEIKEKLEQFSVQYKFSENIYEETASALKNGKIIGWFQGSAEFGPRALGNRSILTSPFPKSMKDYLNSRVKFREEFRPFAPAILYEHTKEYFLLDQESPHMLIAVKVKENKIDKIPAVVHIDNTARVQTVTKENNLKFRKLLESFYKITECPVLLNTSFNVKGQPIVNTPEDAIKCFLNTNIDILVLGDYILTKDNQN